MEQSANLHLAPACTPSHRFAYHFQLNPKRAAVFDSGRALRPAPLAFAAWSPVCRVDLGTLAVPPPSPGAAWTKHPPSTGPADFEPAPAAGRT